MSERVVAYLPVPPKKIACGFYHTAAIANHNKGETVFTTPAAYVWGRNKYNTLGIITPVPKGKSAENKDDKEGNVFVAHPVEKLNNKGPCYEVACGTNHTVFLLKNLEDLGGELYCSGLGTRGRLGCRDPHADQESEIEDTWNSERPLPPNFHHKYPDMKLQILRVVAGSDHTLAFATDGYLYGWGANGQGQCGVHTGEEKGKFDDVLWPTRLPVFEPSGNMAHFAAGAQHSLAAYDTDVYSWGSSRNGRLGTGPVENAPSPCLVDAIADYQIVFVSAGEAHSGCIDEEGICFTWGAGSYGRLGQGEDADVFVPKAVSCFETMGAGQTRVKLKSMAMGGFHTLFLQNAGAGAKLYSCGSGAAVGLLSEGDNNFIQVPMTVSGGKIFPQNQVISQIACGMFHSLVLMGNGELIVWGTGSCGRLGIAEGKSKNQNDPTQIRVEIFRAFDSEKLRGSGTESKTLADPSEKKAQREQRKAGAENKSNKVASWHIKDMSLGSLHSMVLTQGGCMYTWGCNANGQLGLGLPNSSYLWKPELLGVDKKRTVTEIAAGYDYCCAITTLRELWTWGKGTSGQLGTGYARDEFKPKRLDSLMKNGGQAVHVAAGEEHTGCVVRQDRSTYKLYMWGNAESGMLGLGEATVSGINSSPELVELPELEFKDKGGKPNPANSLPMSPLKVACGQTHTAVMFGPSEQFNLRVGADSSGYHNRLLTFGSGWYGKLGLDDENCKNAYAPMPVFLSSSVSVKAVSLGAYHSAMISQDNDLWLWGRAKRCCEAAAQSDVLAPKKFCHIEGMPKIKMVACGEQYTLAVTDADELWVWGDNRCGQLGLGPSAQADVPIPDQARLSPGPLNFVATGTAHTIGSFVTGDAYGWGNQSCGRLGLAEKKQEKLIYEPEKVNAVWASIEAMSKDQNKDNEGADDSSSSSSDSDKEGKAKEEGGAKGKKVAKKSAEEDEEDPMAKMMSQQKVTQFSTMQVLIKQEQSACREDALKDLEQKLQKRFDALVKHIKEIPGFEEGLNNIIGDLEGAVKGNMKHMPKVGLMGSGDTKGDPRVTEKLPIYKDLLWVLQQQVSYLAQLSMCFQDSVGDDAETFYRIVFSIFGEMDSSRCQHLFLMMLRIMMDKETEGSGQKMDEVFSIEKSRAFHVFSRFALSELHYKDVLHPFLQDKRKKGALAQEGAIETLIVELVLTSSRSDIFALNIHEYKRMQNLDDGGKSKEENPEVMVEHAMYQDRFREWLITTFIASISQVQLPTDLRQLLAHALNAVKARSYHQDTSDPVSAAIPPELRPYSPLLRLFCEGILCPFLEKPQNFLNKTKYLVKEFDLLKGDPTLLENMGTLSGFLKLMINNQFDPKDHKILIAAAKTVKPALLKYLKKQADIPDNLEVEIMKDVYLYHFERARHPVCMATSDLLLMSNMLKRFINKLRIKESDEMEALCRQLPTWDEGTIEEFSLNPEQDYQHNFLMQTRFILEMNVKDLVICRATKCPMPSKLVGQKACNGLILSFNGSEDSDNPRRALESLFRDLEPLQAKTFQDMSNEFKKMQDDFKGRSPPNYDMVQRLQSGLTMIEELVNVEAHPEDVLQFMAESIEKRRKFLKYLNQVKTCLDEVEKQKKKFEKDMDLIKKEYVDTRDFAISLKLDEKFNSWAGPIPLNFTLIKNKLEVQRKVGLDPKKMQDLKCTILPIETFAIAKLRKMNIVSDIHANFSPLEKRMNITIKVQNSGDVELVAKIVQGTNQNAVKTLIVTEMKLAEMRRAEKTDTCKLMGSGEEEAFITIICSNFCQLITDLSKRAST